MAQRTDRYDDVDDTPGAETHTLAFDGPVKEIDLSEANAKRLRDLLEPFLSVARPIVEVDAPAAPTKRTFSRPAQPVEPPTSKNGNGKSNGKPKAAKTDQGGVIRAWAKSQGIEVNDRGRVPKELVARYEEEHDGSTAPAPKAPRSNPKRPTNQEILNLHKQVGTYTALAAELGVSVVTATTWFRAAQDALDPVS